MTMEEAITQTLKTCITKMATVLQEKQTMIQTTSNDTSSISAKYVYTFCVNLTLTVLQQSKNVLDVERLYDLDLAVKLYGYATPAIAIVTIILNTAIIVILSRRELRSPTNVILISIAVFDSLTMLCPLPWFVKMYSFRSHEEYPSMPWCHVYVYLTGFLSTVFHNTVMWLTVMLAIHRYIGILKPNMARKLCKYKPVLGGIITILFLMTLLHGTNLIMENVEPVLVVGKKLLTPSGIYYVETCKISPSSYVADVYASYSKVYWWSRVAIGQIMPCLILIVFNCILLKETCQSYQYRSLLVRGNHPAQRSHLREAVRTSAMLITICACALIVEIPITIIFILHILQSQHGLVISNAHVLNICHTLPNFIMFLTFPINFFIYLVLSSAFRKRLLSVFKNSNQKPRDSLISMSVLSSRV